MQNVANNNESVTSIFAMLDDAHSSAQAAIAATGRPTGKANYHVPLYDAGLRPIDYEPVPYAAPVLTGAEFEQGESPTIEPIALDGVMLGAMLD
jgi:hypothetical protein